jgi:hypothetical protein
MRDVYDFEREELEKRGKPFGLSAEQVLAADGQELDLEEYAGYAGVRTVDDLREFERARAEREQARRELRVERVKAEMGGAS